MRALVIGVPDSGKSALAEDLAMKLSGDDKRIYLATMEIQDDEGKRRVEKHRKLREGKGFFTIEAPVHVREAVADEPDLENSTVLVECVSNLVGNVMHDDTVAEGDACLIVTADLAWICDAAKNTVIVTNSFAVSEEFDAETVRYIDCLNEVNDRLRDMADEVYEFAEGEWIRHENN